MNRFHGVASVNAVSSSLGARSEGFFRALADIVPGVIYQSRLGADGNGVVQYMSEGARRVLDCDPAALVGPSHLFRKMIHPEDVGRFQESVAGQLGREGTWQLDYRLVLPTGRVIWISSQASVVLEPDGATIWRGFFTDITERKQAELDEISERERLTLATRAGNIGTWDLDLETGHTQWNDMMYELHGVTPQTYTPGVEVYLTTFCPEHQDMMRERIKDALASDERRSGLEVPVCLPDGQKRLMRTKSKVIRDQSGRAVRFVGITMDVTEEKQAAEMLIRAKEAAQAAANAKSEFLAAMSHEIRTPMNGVLGYVELLKSTALDAEQRQFLQTIESSGEHLLSIINDILDVTQIEAGKVTLRRTAFPVAQCVLQVFEMLKPVARAKGLDYHLDIGGDAPAFIVSDQGRVAQVLTNILGNAIKFTSAGEVRVALSARPIGEGNWEWTFRVTDTGPGVSEAAMEKIFEPFFQEDSSASRVHGGAGLGLAISRNIARLLDGSLEVSRGEGRGSEFRLIINAPAAIEREIVVPSPERPGSLDGCHVLVVEDNPVNRKLCHAMLTRLGCDVTFAEDGLQMIETFAPDTYDIMLVDMQLPHMDGCQATERVREIERERGYLRTPIVAMTANVLNEDRDRCMRAGMDDFLSKPLSQANLRSAIAKWAKVG